MNSTPSTASHAGDGRAAEETVRRTAADAQAKAEQTRDAARAMADTAAEQARAAKEQIRRQAGQAAEQLRGQGEALFDQQKSRLAVTLGDVGGAFRQAAEKLREEEEPRLAGYTETIAGRLEDASRYLQHCGPRDLLDDTRRLARRRPELVLGGMFVGGLALARFLKASPPRAADESAAAPRALPAETIPGEPRGATDEPAAEAEDRARRISAAHPK